MPLDDFTWWENFRSSDAYRRLQSRPVAYFCAEFALTSMLKTYSGGLGVLAGDIVRQAAAQKLPMIGIGLLYDRAVGNKKPEEFGLELVLDRFHQPVTVSVPIQDRHVKVGAYRWPSTKLGAVWWSEGQRTVPVYLLTTDCADNDPRDRCITDQLYPPDKEKRFQQEIILGLGGLRLLEALNIHPAIYHLNEGHSACLALEIIRHEMSERLIGFDNALDLARRHVVFTNHTLVPAGQDTFSNDLVAANLAGYAQELAVPVDRLVNLGLVQESSLFSMTILSLRLAGKINAVSQLHAQKAAEIWRDHPMDGITNGIYVATWDRMRWEVGSEKLDDEVRNGKSHFSPQSEAIPASHFPVRTSEYSNWLSTPKIWQVHQHNKQLLLEKIRKTTGHDWPQDALLIGWARRFVGYKRPLSPFFYPDRLAQICRNQKKPVRIVISGAAHPGDAEGEKLLAELKNLLAAPHDVLPNPPNPPNPPNSQTDQSPFTAYLPDYDLDLAGLMTAGCDVWLNTPVVGFEACGTSGMKAALNGVLPMSTKDGWMAEINPYGIGWLIDSDKVSDSLYQTLENQVIPLYFDNRPEWINNMIHARQLILQNFTTARVLKEYIEKLYLPLTG